MVSDGSGDGGGAAGKSMVGKGDGKLTLIGTFALISAEALVDVEAETGSVNRFKISFNSSSSEDGADAETAGGAAIFAAGVATTGATATGVGGGTSAAGVLAEDGATVVANVGTVFGAATGGCAATGFAGAAGFACTAGFAGGTTGAATAGAAATGLPGAGASTLELTDQ